MRIKPIYFRHPSTQTSPIGHNVKTRLILPNIKTALLPLLVILLISTSGCSTLSKGECIEADWYEIGTRDGANGKPRSVLDNHRESCAKHKITPDREQYYLGRNRGIQSYCTPQNGFRIGKQGGYYHRVCPLNIERSFLNSYELGKEVYNINRDISEVESKIDKLEKKLDKKETKKGKRIKIREEIRILDRQYRELREQLLYLEQSARYRRY